MLRSILIYLSKADWARQLVTRWSFARKVASRFIAGELLDDAIKVIKTLNANQINATLDHLGEHTTNPEKAVQATNDIITILERIDREGVRSGVSIKLTQIGLAVDESLCASNLEKILDKAAELSIFVRIDMEDSKWVDTSLDLFKKSMGKYSNATIGIVIQAYLYRSDEDVSDLLKLGAKVRLCKGAYKEPESIAFPRKSDVDANFDHLVYKLLEGSLANGTPILSDDGRIPPIPAIGSHDESRVNYAKIVQEELGLPKQAIEFQMLHGIRRDLQETLAQEGYPVRVYVPYGSEWYPYFVRRLAERPANLWFFISNFFR
ncbi:MAG: proline dehydrogenase family protein [Anaerolineales bacterium]|jgi:proline dehydrogenase